MASLYTWIWKYKKYVHDTVWNMAGLVLNGYTGGPCGVGKEGKDSREFDVDEIGALPKVAISYFHVDADPETLRYQYMKSAGLIIAGAGNGEMSLLWDREMENLERFGKPIVITSRIHDGIVTLHRKVPSNVLSGDTLNPQKARILLMLALTRTADIAKIRRIFEIY